MIATFRDFFHMGRVEWVTCHVPENQSREGGAKSVEVLGDVVVGGRSLMVVAILFDHYLELVRKCEIALLC